MPPDTVPNTKLSSFNAIAVTSPVFACTASKRPYTHVSNSYEARGLTHIPTAQSGDVYINQVRSKQVNGWLMPMTTWFS